MGSVAAKFRGSNRPGMPPYVALANSQVADIYGAGDLGQQYEPLDGINVNGRFSLPQGVAVPRLQDRNLLRQELDQFRRRLDSSVSFQQQDRYTQEAFDLVLGGNAQKAFDLSQESHETRNRYGRDSMGEKALLARRLVESGVTWVTMSDAWGHWDHHGDEVQWGGIAKGLKMCIRDRLATNPAMRFQLEPPALLLHFYRPVSVSSATKVHSSRRSAICQCLLPPEHSAASSPRNR